LFSTPAPAQSRYTCVDNNGRSYQSSQACAGREVVERYTCTSNGRTYASSHPCPSSGMVYYGPATTTTQSSESRVAKIDQAPDTLKYLSPRCASLNDAIRTAPARGLKYETISEMREPKMIRLRTSRPMWSVPRMNSALPRASHAGGRYLKRKFPTSGLCGARTSANSAVKTSNDKIPNEMSGAPRSLAATRRDRESTAG